MKFTFTADKASELTNIRNKINAEVSTILDSVKIAANKGKDDIRPMIDRSLNQDRIYNILSDLGYVVDVSDLADIKGNNHRTIKVAW